MLIFPAVMRLKPARQHRLTYSTACLLVLSSILPASLYAQATPAEEAEIRHHAERLRIMSCRELNRDLPGRDPKPALGVPDALWTSELFAIMRDRALACAQQVSRSQYLLTRSYIDNISTDALRRADEARATRQAAAKRKIEFLRHLDGIASIPQHERRGDALASLERTLRQSGLDASGVEEVQAAISQAKAKIEDLRRAELKRKEQIDQEAEAGRRRALEQKTADLEKQLATYDPGVANLIRMNPALGRATVPEAELILRTLYNSELILRLCTRKFGTHFTELAETMRRRRILESYSRQVHGRSDESMRQERGQLGVETGTGRVAEMVAGTSSDLRQGCDQMLGYLSSFFDFGP